VPLHACVELIDVGVGKRVSGPPFGQQQAHSRAIEQDRVIGGPRRDARVVKHGTSLADLTALEKDLRKKRRRPLQLQRHAPQLQGRERSAQLRLGLTELTAQVSGVAIPLLHSREPEHVALAMSFSAMSIPCIDGFVEVGERERDRGDHRHQSVHGEQRPAVERRAGERAHAIGRTCLLGPVPCGDGRECPGSDPCGHVDLAMRAESLALIAARLGAKEESEKLHRLEVSGEIIELGGELVQRGRTFVPQLALAGGEVAVNGGAHQGVHKPERRLRSQDLGAHELSCCGGDRRRLELGKVGYDGDLRAVAQHRDCACDFQGVPRQPGKTQQHRPRGRPRSQFGDEVRVGGVGRQRSAASDLRSSLTRRGLPSVAE
jgi:hypothetical protein